MSKPTPSSALSPTHRLSLPPYVIGDLQGCWHGLQALLARLPEPEAPHIYLGDLINRGPASLTTLRYLHKEATRAPNQTRTLLGNHDLHFLAVASGVRKASRSDTLDEILAAPECPTWVAWLRRQPLALSANGFLLVHAGVLPQWSVTQVLELAEEVQEQLAGPNYQDFLVQMYGNTPNQWSPTLRGAERWRVVVNALTRLRYCSVDGVMDFETKEGLGAAPEGYMPWFDVPNRQTAQTPIVFGHWSALGLMVTKQAIGLDSGCVWGGKLSAMALAQAPEQRVIVQADCGAGLDPLAFSKKKKPK